jgi:hypothetical protein
MKKYYADPYGFLAANLNLDLAINLEGKYFESRTLPHLLDFVAQKIDQETVKVSDLGYCN